MRFGGSNAARRKNVVLTALLAVCFLSGQLAGFRHLVEVQHTRCAEHDELIDLPQSAPVAGAVRSESGSRFAAAPEQGSDHRHEHCALAPSHRSDVVVAQSQAVVADAPPSPDGAALVDHAVVALARAVYRIAPKNSPPV
jgi:hypothetical protein